MKTGLLVQATSDFLAADLRDLGLFQEELCPVSSLSSYFTVTFCSVVVNWVHPTKEAFMIINLLTFHYYNIFLLGCPLCGRPQGLWKQFSPKREEPDSCLPRGTPPPFNRS